MKASFDAKLNAVHPKPFEPQSTDFDKLRKRVIYLTKNSKNEKNETFVPSNMQIHDKFVNLDQEERKKKREEREKEGTILSPDGSDSDDSIREIKRNKKKQLARLDLATLSDS